MNKDNTNLEDIFKEYNEALLELTNRVASVATQTSKNFSNLVKVSGDLKDVVGDINYYLYNHGVKKEELPDNNDGF